MSSLLLNSQTDLLSCWIKLLFWPFDDAWSPLKVSASIITLQGMSPRFYFFSRVYFLKTFYDLGFAHTNGDPLPSIYETQCHLLPPNDQIQKPLFHPLLCVHNQPPLCFTLLRSSTFWVLDNWPLFQIFTQPPEFMSCFQICSLTLQPF